MAKCAWAVLGLASVLAPVGAQAQVAPGASGLEAGGLAPPGSGPADPAVPSPRPEQDLVAAEEKDSGRGLEVVWLDGEIGYQLVGLQTFHDGDLVHEGLVETRQGGLMFGGGFGLRLVFLTFGPRFRFGTFAEWKHWTLDAEVGLRIPFGRLEPYAVVAGGYASVGDVPGHDGLDDGDVKIRGGNLRVGVGADIYLSQAFTLGGVVTGDALFLTRPAVRVPDAAGDGAVVYAEDGSGVGAAFAATAVARLHF
ncbi:MAG: hypothetical protein JW751_14930 [Polyangiaceae bacterium]|nr:hypothetical protein [Polyangiaceae bacterium]